jgi:hypothetical protein
MTEKFPDQGIMDGSRTWAEVTAAADAYLRALAVFSSTTSGLAARSLASRPTRSSQTTNRQWRNCYEPLPNAISTPNTTDTPEDRVRVLAEVRAWRAKIGLISHPLPGNLTYDLVSTPEIAAPTEDKDPAAIAMHDTISRIEASGLTQHVDDDGKKYWTRAA